MSDETTIPLDAKIRLSPEQLKQYMRAETHKVLDDGFIKYVDHMGDDARIVEAARLTAKTEGITAADDRTLLRYLMRHRHTTPVEFGVINLHVRVPMDTWRQWIRHRTATVNEFSTRYSPAINEKAKTAPDAWRLQSKNNRQGSSGDFVTEWPAGYSVEEEDVVKMTNVDFGGTKCDDAYLLASATPGGYLSSRESDLHAKVAEIYSERLQFGVANEQARKDLPLSTYTEAYWQINLHNLFHFLGLRMDSHAQWEIRQYANVIGREIVAKLFPVAWEAFVDYRLENMELTRLDIGVIQRLQGEVLPHTPGWITFLSLQDPSWKDLKRCRERDECWEKLHQLGIVGGAKGE